MHVSLFNDVIGPVMRGPSSSHCAAALRIGRLARGLVQGTPDDILIEFDRKGSLPTTHDSQGSDMGLFGGLLGWDAADERLPGSMKTFLDSGSTARIVTIDADDPHPNTYRLTVRRGKITHFIRAISTGGGMIEVLNVDAFQVRMFGDAFTTLVWLTGDAEKLVQGLKQRCDPDDVIVHRGQGTCLVEIKSGSFIAESIFSDLSNASQGDFLITHLRHLGPVLPVLTRRSSHVPFTTCAEMLAWDAGQNTPLWKLAASYECARGGMSEAEVLQRMTEIVRILRRSIEQGIAGTTYEDRVLGHQSGRFAELLQQGRLLNAGALNRIILYVTALMEVKSSMGVIVAAPTAGACAALPAAVIGMAEEMGLDEAEMAKALLASGIIGAFIATRWTFAAEVGGCQAEGGSAACMAAAALTGMAGGSLQQCVTAASLALQSMLGLICDPIANRVEAPCLGKNVMAAANAVSCANMALAGYNPLIPLDEVIEAAMKVAEAMPREHRCTALGGLSVTPSSKAIEQRLALTTSKAGGCGGCGCRS